MHLGRGHEATTRAGVRSRTIVTAIDLWGARNAGVGSVRGIAGNGKKAFGNRADWLRVNVGGGAGLDRSGRPNERATGRSHHSGKREQAAVTLQSSNLVTLVRIRHRFPTNLSVAGQRLRYRCP